MKLKRIFNFLILFLFEFLNKFEVEQVKKVQNSISVEAENTTNVNETVENEEKTVSNETGNVIENSAEQ